VQSQTNASESEINTIIGKWLVQAPLRCKKEMFVYFISIFYNTNTK
jgi:hypothetical protein